jgi:hypothetical protein
MTELKERRYLIRKPRALQYFHRGEFKRELEKERVAGRFELFLDLLCESRSYSKYVNIVGWLPADPPRS